MTQWTNGQTLAAGYRRGSYAEPKSDTSMLVFTSFTARGVTNATCNMTTSYVEAEISCQGLTCRSLRIRTVETPQNITLRTVLDGLRAPWYKEPFIIATHSFLSGFVNASNSPWNNRWAEDPYSTPIECYFTHPDSPYIAPVFRTSERHSFQSCDIYPISDRDFSEKLTQLLNTFWIVNIAPRSGIGNFTYGGPDSIDDVVLRQNATGTRTPDRIVTRTDIPWLIVLVVASLSMLSAGVAAAVLGALRRGPDVLDRATIFLRSNPNAELPQTSSMEDGIEQARRVKHVRVCVGDVKSQDDVGEVALGTVGNLIPLSWQKDGRVYS